METISLKDSRGISILSNNQRICLCKNWDKILKFDCFRCTILGKLLKRLIVTSNLPDEQ